MTSKRQMFFLARLVAVPVLLFCAIAASPAWAKHHHHSTAAAHRHGDSQQQSKADVLAPGSKVDQGSKENADTKLGNKIEPGPKESTDSKPSAKTDTNAKTIPAGDDHAGSRTGFGTIDTSNTIMGPSKFKTVHKTPDWKKSKIAHRPGNPNDLRQTSAHVGKARVVVNAIGLHVPQKGSEHKENHVPGLATLPADSAQKSDPVGTAGIAAVRPDLRRQGFVPAPGTIGKPAEPVINAAVNHAALNGHGMIRPGSSAGVIGGAPGRMAGGVISGTDFHPKMH
jgi:hypothetical protein